MGNSREVLINKLLPKCEQSAGKWGVVPYSGQEQWETLKPSRPEGVKGGRSCWRLEPKRALWEGAETGVVAFS